MKLERTAISVVDTDDSSDRDYWLRQSPEARLRAIQIHRQAAYGRADASGRVQRVLEVAERV